MLNYDNISIAQATAIQNELRDKIILETQNTSVRTIAGADISHNKDTDVVYAGIVVLSYPEMVLQSYTLVIARTKFPYVPGFLGFREVPCLLQAWQLLPEKPDILVLDGHGITHQRGAGIASQFGIIANTATIGCAKNMLFGNYAPLGLEKFSRSPIMHNSQTLGYALRTKTGVKPVYISPGHKITVEDTLNIIKHCTGKYRIPEPTRIAHEKVNLFRVGKLTAGHHTVTTQPDLFS